MKYKRYILILYCMCIFMQLNYEKNQGMNMSFSDMLVNISGCFSCLFLHIPFYGALVIDSHSNDLNPLRVIMHRSSLHVVRNQQKRSIILAILMIVIALMSMIAFALTNGCSIHVSVDLALKFVLCFLIRFYIWANIILLSKWVLNSFACGLLINLVMGFFDVISRGLPTEIKIDFISRIFSVDSELWSTGRLIGKISIFTAIIAVMIIIYMYIAQKREFIDE